MVVELILHFCHFVIYLNNVVMNVPFFVYSNKIAHSLIHSFSQIFRYIDFSCTLLQDLHVHSCKLEGVNMFFVTVIFFMWV